MNQYNVIKVKEDNTLKNDIWQAIPCANIDTYPWGGEYQPKAVAQLIYTEKSFYLKLTAIEPSQNIRSQEYGISKFVYQDSCLEFFFMPVPDKDKRYINLEFNPKGALYIGVGESREDNQLLVNQDMSVFNIATFSHEFDEGIIKWGIIAKIPFSFLIEQQFNIDYYSGYRIKGNFYKCGDLTPSPHYGVWNRINWPQPDYHRPEFFGDIVLL